MKVTGEMMDAAMQWTKNNFHPSNWPTPRAVGGILAAGVADVPEPVPGPFVLSPTQESDAQACEYLLATSPSKCDASAVKTLLRMLREYFPKPVPKQRTPEELREIVVGVSRASDELSRKEALDELVALAKEKR